LQSTQKWKDLLLKTQIQRQSKRKACNLLISAGGGGSNEERTKLDDHPIGKKEAKK
jgi:hypothetical protein